MIDFNDYKNTELLEAYNEIQKILEERGLLIKLQEKSIEELQKEAAIKANSNWHFMIDREDNFVMVYVVEKQHWKDFGYIDDCPSDQNFIVPPKYGECQEMAYDNYSFDFIKSKIWQLTDSECDMLEEAYRKDFIEYGFTEVLWSDHPENK